MKNLVVVIFLCFFVIGNSFGQKYFTKTGNVSFHSDTPMEKIEGFNKSVNCVLDGSTGQMEFGILIKGFQFEKALMQEHFNENYMESSKFPKSTFKGKIDQYKSIDFSKNGKFNVKVTGDLTIHGVTKNISTNGVVSLNNGVVELSSDFSVAVADYNISIPSLVKDNIAKNVNVNVKASLKPLK